MAKIYSFKRIVTPGPFGTVFEFLPNGVSCSANMEKPLGYRELGVAAGRVYLEIADPDAIPPQFSEIDFKEDTLPPEIADTLAEAALNRELADYDRRLQVLKDNLLTAVLADDQDGIKAAKDDYKTLTVTEE